MAEETITEEKAESETDQDMLAVINDIMGPDGTETEDDDIATSEVETEEKPKKPARERNPDGSFKKKEPVSEETDAEAKPKDTPQPAVPDGVQPGDYAKALNALHRDGTPPSIIDSMEPTEVVKWGLARAKTQAEIDGYRNEITELKKRPEVPAEAPQAPSMNLDEGIKPFVEQYGEEAAEPLKAFGEALAAQVYAQAHSEVNEKTSRLEAIEQRLLGQEREAARTGLEKQYKLNQPERWQQVLERRQMDSFPYTSESDALRASCQVLFSDELLSEAKANKAETNAARSNGQPTTQTKGSPPPERLTPEQQFAKNEREIAFAIVDGDDARVKALSSEGEKMRKKQLAF